MSEKVEKRMAFDNEPFILFLGWFHFFPIIVFSILLNYTGGRLIDWFRQKGKESWSKICFIAAIILNLGNLIYWKYAKFLLETVQDITGVRFSIPDIILPIGISFFTFQGMSYVIDLYRKKVPVQKAYPDSHYISHYFHS